MAWLTRVDTTACFGPTICILSLGSDIGMTFAKLKETTDGPSSSQNEESNVSSVSDSGGQSVQVMLPRRSLLLLRGHARYRYTHGIASRNTDKYRGAVVERGRRVSMTFRQVITSRVCSIWSVLGCLIVTCVEKTDMPGLCALLIPLASPVAIQYLSLTCHSILTETYT